MKKGIWCFLHRGNSEKIVIQLVDSGFSWKEWSICRGLSCRFLSHNAVNILSLNVVFYVAMTSRMLIFTSSLFVVTRWLCVVPLYDCVAFQFPIFPYCLRTCSVHFDSSCWGPYAPVFHLSYLLSLMFYVFLIDKRVALGVLIRTSVQYLVTKYSCFTRYVVVFYCYHAIP